MLKKTFELRYQAERLIDALIAFISLSLAGYIRRSIIEIYPDVLPVFDFWPQAGWLYVLVIAIWLVLFDILGLYAHKSAHTPAKTVSILVRTQAFGIMLAFFMFYVLQIKHIPRVLVFLYAAINFVLMCGKEMVLRYLEPRWQPSQNLLLVGLPSEFSGLLERARNSRPWTLNIVGLLVPADTQPNVENGDALPEVTRLGTVAELERVLESNSVDYVVLSPSKERFQDVQHIISVCETVGVETWVLGSFFRTSIAKAHVDEFQDLPMLIFSTTPSLSWALIFKRLIDIVGSIASLILTGPIMLAAALAIKLTSPGPALFKQRRCSVHGREFWMYKFRTMVNEAEQLRSEMQGRNEVSGPVFKIWDDPRVTRVGRFLRRYSIDELPQLWNVLRGSMSLVGPRPPIPSEVKDYKSWQRRRLSMRPGITCLWQTSGRNQVSFEDWMKLDLQYIDNWSLGLDLKILLRTPVVVLQGSGV